MLYCWV